MQSMCSEFQREDDAMQVMCIDEGCKYQENGECNRDWVYIKDGLCVNVSEREERDVHE